MRDGRTVLDRRARSSTSTVDRLVTAMLGGALAAVPAAAGRSRGDGRGAASLGLRLVESSVPDALHGVVLARLPRRDRRARRAAGRGPPRAVLRRGLRAGAAEPPAGSLLPGGVRPRSPAPGRSPHGVALRSQRPQGGRPDARQAGVGERRGRAAGWASAAAARGCRRAQQRSSARDDADAAAADPRRRRRPSSASSPAATSRRSSSRSGWRPSRRVLRARRPDPRRRHRRPRRDARRRARTGRAAARSC